jgi:hypothetical protein
MWVATEYDEIDRCVTPPVLLVKVVDEYSVDVDVLYVPQTLAGQIWKSLDECTEAFGVSV